MARLHFANGRDGLHIMEDGCRWSRVATVQSKWDRGTTGEKWNVGWYKWL